MNFETKYITTDIKLSTYEGKMRKSEIAFKHHMLVWFISGETKIIQADNSYVFKAGDIFLIPRNQLASIISCGNNGLPHRAVVMHLSAARLRNYYEALDVKPHVSVSQKIRSFSDHPLLKSCLASLIPYFDLSEQFPEHIASLKITEAVSILRHIDPDIDSVLANFDEPGKIDLVGFMEKNYMFNMPLEKFSYLTGRGLTTFKRDFFNAFAITPQRWLTNKRLELAHYLLSQKQAKPADIYLEVGFENISHFSFAFKKKFGYPPTEIGNKSAHRPVST